MIGNPVKIGTYNATTDTWGTHYELTWEGRKLVERKQVSSSGTVSNPNSYTYNADGIRTSKTVNGVVHEYYLNGSQIVAETWQANGLEYLIHYLYDESGTPIGMKYRYSSLAAGVYYSFFFEKNLQGDIIAIYNEDGTKIGSYTYDAWGAVTTVVTSGVTSMESSVVRNLNPFRYRGYYYDTETGYYYLQSRYYNPGWGRFINAEPNAAEGGFDFAAGLIGYNIFVYSANNPINFVDPTGEFIFAALIIGAVAGAIIGGAIGGTIAYNAAKESGVEGVDLLLETAEGVAKGALIGSVAGGLVGATTGTILAYGAASTAGTAMITVTATVSARITEVVALQSKKSSNDNDTKWQMANDCLTSVFNNGVNLVLPIPTKAATTTGLYFVTDIMKYKVTPLPVKDFLKQPGGKLLPYGSAALAWGSTFFSIFCSDPVARANQRGYTLQ